MGQLFCFGEVMGELINAPPSSEMMGRLINSPPSVSIFEEFLSSIFSTTLQTR